MIFAINFSREHRAPIVPCRLHADTCRVSLNDSTYYFNPCKTFNVPINGDPHTVNGEQCHNVLGCKRVRQRADDYEYYTVAIRMNSTVLPNSTPMTTRYYGSK